MLVLGLTTKKEIIRSIAYIRTLTSLVQTNDPEKFVEEIKIYYKNYKPIEGKSLSFSMTQECLVNELARIAEHGLQKPISWHRQELVNLSMAATELLELSVNI